MELGGREIGQFTEPFLPVLTPDGVRHPIFANIAGFFPTRQGAAENAGLPPLDGCTRVEGARPGATVLATLAGRSGPDARAGRAAAGSRPHRRLRRRHHAEMAARSAGARPGIALPAVLGADGPLAGRPGRDGRGPGRRRRQHRQGRLRAGRDDPHLRPSSATSEGQGADNAKVVASVNGPAGKPEQVALSAVAGSQRPLRRRDRAASRPARYEVVVEARLGELSLTSEKIRVEVGRPNLEFERLDLDEKMLAAIAAATGGRYVPLSAADHLIDQLDRAQQKKTVYVEQRLYWPPGFWALFVAVLTTEWILQKEISTQIEVEQRDERQCKKEKWERGKRGRKKDIDKDKTEKNMEKENGKGRCRETGLMG